MIVADKDCFTAVFDYDIRHFRANPHKAKTPFGYAVRCGIGDAFNDVDKAEDEITRLRTLLDDAEKALEPFAYESDEIGGVNGDALIVCDGIPIRDETDLTVGDFRSALIAYEAIQQYKEEKER